ncbi:hypothetical protein B5X24_HaOG212500 [Helicoverpa armigera]|nr:hypothetical protein B5X24_HaOG212500 [Helicoverpa armigera]
MIYEKPQVNGGVGPPPRPRTFRRNCGDQVFITSPTKVYIETSAKCAYYSQNDERPRRRWEELGDRVRLIDVLERTVWPDIRTILQDGKHEIQDLIAFFAFYPIDVLF